MPISRVHIKAAESTSFDIVPETVAQLNCGRLWPLRELHDDDDDDDDDDNKNTGKKSSGMSSMRNPMLQDGDDDDEHATD